MFRTLARAPPTNWTDFTPIGSPIRGTPFIVFKTPLDARLNNKLPEKGRFGVENVLKAVPNLGLVIDLTFDIRYYEPNEFLQKGINCMKISRRGTPPPILGVKEFFRTVDDYIASPMSAGKIIGVLCITGMKRSCYYVCRYMIQRLEFPPVNAIAEFEDARGQGKARTIADVTLDYIATLITYKDSLEPIGKTKPLLKLGSQWLSKFFGPNRNTTGIPNTPKNWADIREENLFTSARSDSRDDRNLVPLIPRTRSRSPNQEPDPSNSLKDFGSERERDNLRNCGPGQSRGPLDFDKGLHGMQSNDNFGQGQFRSTGKMERGSGGSMGMALSSNFMMEDSSAPMGMALNSVGRGSFGGLMETDPSGSMGMGPSGPMGIGGYSGPMGMGGYSGPTGMGGYSGPTGMGGYSGPTGMGGYSGPKGMGGYSGPTGMGGYSGPMGMGPSGPMGMGPSGPMGMGPSGPMGMGTSGPMGMGPSGPMGMGPSGPMGMFPSGPTGMAGPSGHLGMDPVGPMGMGDSSGPMGMGFTGSMAMGSGNYMVVNRGPVGPLVNEFNNSDQQGKADESGRGGLRDRSDYHALDHSRSPRREHKFSRDMSPDRRQRNRSSSYERRSPGRRIRDNRSSSYERRKSPGRRIKDDFEKTRFSRFDNRSRSNSQDRERRNSRDRSPWDSRDSSRRNGRDISSDGFRHSRSRSPLRTPPPPRIGGVGQNSSSNQHHEMNSSDLEMDKLRQLQRLNEVLSETMKVLAPRAAVKTAPVESYRSRFDQERESQLLDMKNTINELLESVKSVKNDDQPQHIPVSQKRIRMDPSEYRQLPSPPELNNLNSMIPKGYVEQFEMKRSKRGESFGEIYKFQRGVLERPNSNPFYRA